jgi:hypothetical protein
MTPKEKAEALVLKFTNLVNYDFVSDLQWHDPTNSDRNRRVKKDAKKCALIAVQEILEILWHTHKNASEYEYWQEVKKEIEKI